MIGPQLKKFSPEQFTLKFKRAFYFSADNAMELAIYLMAKEFMKKCGNEQYEYYKSKTCVRDEHSDQAVKTYKKINKAISAIDKIVEEKGEFDSIRDSELTKHVETLWKHREILWT